MFVPVQLFQMSTEDGHVTGSVLSDLIPWLIADLPYRLLMMNLPLNYDFKGSASTFKLPLSCRYSLHCSFLLAKSACKLKLLRPVDEYCRCHTLDFEHAKSL